MRRMRLFLVALSLTLFLPNAFAQRKSQGMELGCPHIYPIQMKYLEKHVNFSRLNNNLEARTVDQYISRLDPQKLYFLEKDVNKVKSLMAGFFKKSQAKDCQPLEQLQRLYLSRIEERVNYAKKYLSPKFVFNPTAKIMLDPKARKRGKTPAEVNKYHNSYLQYQIATYLATDMKMDEAKQQVVRNYERLQRRVKDMQAADVWSAYLDSFARSLDPHSSYLSADQLEDFEIQMRLSLEGIGATLSSQDGFTVIEQLIPGGAAFNSSQLKPKDKIIAVAQGKEGEFQNVIEMELRDVVRLIRGPKGSEVRLKILRKSAKEPERFEVTLVRDQIKLEDEAASITYIQKETGGLKKKIGLLTLPSFYADNKKNGPSAAKDMKRLLAEAKNNNVDALVLDLSTNGGGSLKDAVDIAGLFFATGNVVKQSQRSLASEGTEYEVLKDTDGSVDYAGPLVILTSRVSASASEIVSGTLQDYNRGIVVGGDHTFGKGTVQSVEYLPPGLGAIKTTVGMFFVAGGKSTQHSGVDSDIQFPSVYSTDDIGEKNLDYSLPPKKIKDFTSEAAYTKDGKAAFKKLEPELIKKLREKSMARIAASPEFKKVKDEIAKVKKRNNLIAVADLVKEKDKTKDKAKAEEAGLEAGEDPGDEGVNLSREERKKKYMERADIQEALNVAFDLALTEGEPEITVGAKDKKAGLSPAPVVESGAQGSAN